MPSLKSIRTRIASVKSTQKITRAMKLVAAARLRRAQDAIVGARPYANALLEAVAEVALRAGAESHPLLDQRAQDRIGVVVLTSDRGLAGGFNANIFRAVQRFVQERARADGQSPEAGKPPQLSLYVLGKKGRDHFRRRKSLTVTQEFAGAAGNVAEARAQELALIVIDHFRTGRIDGVYLVFNEFKSAVQQRTLVEPLLPLTPASFKGTAAASAEPGQIDFLYEPDKQQLLDALLPLFVESQIYRALLESIASEFGARMTAMDSATGNAKEVIARLTLQYNRARQAAITKELMEIVGGAEALKG
ncbi:MAG TPA: ATP synthase F1 subunit gamma [Polyangia bacterium]|jgi:F-type H+-transporting ATPase subunit gamma|nr:ATP synthase F1 subunit gamma [Polyangia bacterium]